MLSACTYSQNIRLHVYRTTTEWRTEATACEKTPLAAHCLYASFKRVTCSAELRYFARFVMECLAVVSRIASTMSWPISDARCLCSVRMQIMYLRVLGQRRAEVQRIGSKDPPHFEMIYIKPDVHPRDDSLVLLTDLTTVIDDCALREWFSKKLVPLNNAFELLLNLGCIIC